MPNPTTKSTHVRDPGVGSSDPKQEVSASGRNSSGAPAESPLERQTVQKTIQKSLLGCAHGGACKVSECRPVPKPRPQDLP